MTVLLQLVYGFILIIMCLIKGYSIYQSHKRRWLPDRIFTACWDTTIKDDASITLQKYRYDTGLIRLLVAKYGWYGVSHIHCITGVQTTQSSRSLCTSSFTPAPPSKRPRVKVEDDDVSIAGCSSVTTGEESDLMLNPAHTSVTEPTDVP